MTYCDVLFIFTALHLTPSSLHDLLQSHSLPAATLCDNTAAKHLNVVSAIMPYCSLMLMVVARVKVNTCGGWGRGEGRW